MAVGEASAVMRKRSESRIEIESRILNAAEQMFAEGGFGGTSMQQIAEKAGLPKANLHYYFSTKETLYRYVVQRIFTDWLDAAHAFDANSPPETALSAYIDAKMDISRERPAGSKVWAAEVMQGAPAAHYFIDGTLRTWMKDREAAIHAWIDAGQIKPVEPRYLLYMIWATTQHYADFTHQIETLNDGRPLSDSDWQCAKMTVKRIILNGLGLEPC